jgi:hypothetical protein
MTIPAESWPDAQAIKGAEETPKGADGSKGIGDINSTAKGSGARYNAGKVPLELVPLSAIFGAYARLISQRGPCWVGATTSKSHALSCLGALGEWQEGGGTPLLTEALLSLGELSKALEAAACVFDYGRGKYAEWNWAKGMPWSAPLGCAARHLVDILEGEDNDKESGLPLIGHVACNIIMLMTYASNFKEGDDRPTMLKPEVTHAG